MAGRHVVIAFNHEGRRGKRGPRGWWVTYPSGHKRKWNSAVSGSFDSWVQSFLRHDGDSVEVRYTKYSLLYRLDVVKNSEKGSS